MTVTTLHALGYATGALLCIMMGVLQWRSAPDRGVPRMLSVFWLCGLLWAGGSFTMMMLTMSGVPRDSALAKGVYAIAWSSTSIGLAATSAALLWPIRSWPGVVLLILSAMSEVVIFLLFMGAGFIPDFPLSILRVANISFLSLTGHLPIWAVLHWRTRVRRGGSRTSEPAIMFWTAASLFAVLAGATAYAGYAPAGHPLLLRITEFLGAQWVIPATVLAAVSLARTHYADVVLKRSLLLILSVVIAAAVAWRIPGLPRGLPLVMASLVGAGLILAAPAFHRALGFAVERLLLRKPDYRALARSFADEARRTVDSGALGMLTEQRIGEALGLEARFVSAAQDAERVALARGRMIDLSPRSRARSLMQAEHAFLAAVGEEMARREETLAFEAERREREGREARLQAAAVEARLEALRAQVDPHFLFNTLNTIADLIARDPAAAEAMTERLSAFFRYTLQRQERTASTLDEELDFVRHYLAIEQVRFGDRLKVRIDREDGLGDEMVPSLILQPLVENAIRHGLAARRSGGTVQVTARRDGGALRLEVADDGAGFRKDSLPGVGLGNVRERLRALHGDAASLAIGAGLKGRGSSIILLAPLS